MNLQYPINYIVFDLETTGFESGKDDILEIAALKISGAKVVDEFSCLLKATIPSRIIQLTGITAEMVEKEGKDPKEALNSFLDFVGGTQAIVGHNIFRFDFKFLLAACSKILKWPLGQVREFGSELENNAVDTAAIFKGVLMNDRQRHNEIHRDYVYRMLESAPGRGMKFNLVDACKHYNILARENHRALADVKLTNELYKALCGK